MSLREFKKIVKAANPEQRHNLGELTGSGFGSDPDTLCNHIRYLRAGSIGQLFWDESWKQVVTDVADHVGIDWLALLNGRRWKQLETYEIENAVVVKVFQDMFDRLPTDQREKVILEMQRNSDDASLEGLLLTGGAMTAAKLSGFGVYLMASTVLGDQCPWHYSALCGLYGHEPDDRVSHWPGGLVGFVWRIGFYAESAQLAAPYLGGSVCLGDSAYIC